MLRDDIRECPTTWGLAATWVVVFLAMLAVQKTMGVAFPASGLFDQLGVSPKVGHRFGDLTWDEVRRGEAWRLVTATFIHFTLLHIGMNLAALVKLGQLMEPWYGAGPFLAVCLIIGGLGNLVGGLLRVAMTTGRTLLAGSPLARVLPRWFETGGPAGIEAIYHIPSGGGSTILLGLLGLGAVVGWRSKTRIGSFLRDQMVAALGMTAVLGVVLVNLLDNYGHTGGAIVGAGIGFLHRPLIRVSERSQSFRGACWLGSLLLIGSCLLAATRDDRAEVALRARYNQVQTQFQRDNALVSILDQTATQFARLVSLAIDQGVWDDSWGLDRIELDLLLKRLVPELPARPDRDHLAETWIQTRRELAGALNALDAQGTTNWEPDVALALTDLKRLGLAVINQPPNYSTVYDFVLAWRTARGAIAADLSQAKSEQVALERQAR